jgi:pimeloyl-ACP methyl ester carboxylesterase
MSSFVFPRVFPGPPALHYVELSSAGAPLLLMHGVTRNLWDWEPLLPELVKDWRVVAFDHRGHGQSSRASGYLVADYARDAAEFVRGTFSEPVTLVGHSLGAMAALSVAAECPSMIAALVLEDPPFHTMGRAIGESAYRAQFSGMQEVARRGGMPSEAAEGLADIRLPTAGGEVRLGDVRDRASLQFLAECLIQVDPGVFEPLVAGRWLDAFDYESLWPRVMCPTLLLQGDRAAGGAFTEVDAAVAQRSLANCRLARFSGVGHQIHRTRPAEVIEHLREFLRPGR